MTCTSLLLKFVVNEHRLLCSHGFNVTHLVVKWIFGDLPFDWTLQHVHPNLSNGVMHNRDFVRWEKISPNLYMLAITHGLHTRKVTCCYVCTWHTLSSSWDHLPKHTLPNPQNIPHAWSVSLCMLFWLIHLVNSSELAQRASYKSIFLILELDLDEGPIHMSN